MRRHLTFRCENATLVGTLDDAQGEVGLLIVSGGNEVRAGAWNGQALLAARLAARGVPVFRFDRRGVGDSEGDNAGFRQSAPDIVAAAGAFRTAAPGVRRVVAWGNCDAASALMLGSGLGLDGLILSNPWTYDPPPEQAGNTETPSGAALRAHYLRRLRDPAALLRVLRGNVSLGGLVRSLLGMARPTKLTALAREIAGGLAEFRGPAIILLAGRDRTAQAFRSGWPARDRRLAVHAEGSHSFVELEARKWLENNIYHFITSEFTGNVQGAAVDDVKWSDHGSAHG